MRGKQPSVKDRFARFAMISEKTPEQVLNRELGMNIEVENNIYIYIYIYFLNFIIKFI